jgi:UDP-N-acetylglucosamine transferase subunit ALG13/GT2 family glycosyltransferase
LTERVPTGEPARGASGSLPLLLVTVGTDHHPFARLIAWIDRWLGDGGTRKVRAIIQHGTAPAPVMAEAHAHVGYLELQAEIRRATVVVTHAGATTIMESRRAGRIPIIVPRRPELGEIVDAHQIAFGRRMHATGMAVNCESEADLRLALDRASADPCTLLLGTTPGSKAGSVTAQVPAGVHRAGELLDGLLSGTPERAARHTRQPEGSKRAAGELMVSLDELLDGPLVKDEEHEPLAWPADRASWPSVSVVVTTRGDRPELLARALTAITTQDYSGRIDCTVVTDGEYGEISAERARVIHNTRAPGLAGARNTGILAASGDLVAFCDDDDVWLQGKLQAQAAALAVTPPAALACCGIEVEYGASVVARVLPGREITLADLLRSRLAELHSSTFVARRSALLSSVGLVSEDIPGSYGEDYELLLRASRHGPVINVPLPGVRVLWHERSHFDSQWATIVPALSWLLGRYPEFRAEPAGFARVAGQIAFAAAACGERRTAWRWARRALRARLLEPRGYLAVGVLAGLLQPDTLVRALHRRGRGV